MRFGVRPRNTGVAPRTPQVNVAATRKAAFDVARAERARTTMKARQNAAAARRSQIAKAAAEKAAATRMAQRKPLKKAPVAKAVLETAKIQRKRTTPGTKTISERVQAELAAKAEGVRAAISKKDVEALARIQVDSTTRTVERPVRLNERKGSLLTESEAVRAPGVKQITENDLTHGGAEKVGGAHTRKEPWPERDPPPTLLPDSGSIPSTIADNMAANADQLNGLAGKAGDLASNAARNLEGIGGTRDILQGLRDSHAPPPGLVARAGNRGQDAAAAMADAADSLGKGAGAQNNRANAGQRVANADSHRVQAGESVKTLSAAVDVAGGRLLAAEDAFTAAKADRAGVISRLLAGASNMLGSIRGALGNIGGRVASLKESYIQKKGETASALDRKSANEDNITSTSAKEISARGDATSANVAHIDAASNTGSLNGQLNTLNGEITSRTGTTKDALAAAETVRPSRKNTAGLKRRGDITGEDLPNANRDKNSAESEISRLVSEREALKAETGIRVAVISSIPPRLSRFSLEYSQLSYKRGIAIRDRGNFSTKKERLRAVKDRQLERLRNKRGLEGGINNHLGYVKDLETVRDTTGTLLEDPGAVRQDVAGDRVDTSGHLRDGGIGKVSGRRNQGTASERVGNLDNNLEGGPQNIDEGNPMEIPRPPTPEISTDPASRAGIEAGNAARKLQLTDSQRSIFKALLEPLLNRIRTKRQDKHESPTDLDNLKRLKEKAAKDKADAASEGGLADTRRVQLTKEHIDLIKAHADAVAKKIAAISEIEAAKLKRGDDIKIAIENAKKQLKDVIDEMNKNLTEKLRLLNKKNAAASKLQAERLKLEKNSTELAKADSDTAAAKKAMENSDLAAKEAARLRGRLEGELLGHLNEADTLLRNAEDAYTSAEKNRPPVRLRDADDIITRLENLKNQLDKNNTLRGKINELLGKINNKREKLKDLRENLRIQKLERGLAWKKRNRMKNILDRAKGFARNIFSILPIIAMFLLPFLFPRRPMQPPLPPLPSGASQGGPLGPPTASRATTDGETSGATPSGAVVPLPQPPPQFIINRVCTSGSSEYLRGCNDGRAKGSADGQNDGGIDEKAHAARIIPFTQGEIEKFVDIPYDTFSAIRQEAYCTQVITQASQLGINSEVIKQMYPQCYGPVQEPTEDEPLDDYDENYGEKYGDGYGYGYGYGDYGYGETQKGGASDMNPILAQSSEYIRGYTEGYTDAYKFAYATAWAISRNTSYQYVNYTIRPRTTQGGGSRKTVPVIDSVIRSMKKRPMKYKGQLEKIRDRTIAA